MIFKYSNVIVNRSKKLARVAFMHCIASDACIWISTIISETMEYILFDAYKQYIKPSEEDGYSRIFSGINEGKWFEMINP